MSAKTKSVLPNPASPEHSLAASVKADTAQAKPKSTSVGKKRGDAVAMTHRVEGALSDAPGANGEDPKVQDSKAPTAAVSKTAAKIAASAGRKVSKPLEASSTGEQGQVGKGMVEVSDRKLKRTVESNDVVSEPAEMVSAPSVSNPGAPQTKSVEHNKPLEQNKLMDQMKATEVKAAVAKPVAAKTEDKSKVAKVVGNRQGFKTLEYIVYPAHGVGQITAIEEQEVAGYKLELFVISFVKDKMILKVPTPKVASVGMRKLAEAPVVKRALDTLTGRARVKRTMWSRRAQEYEAKINSGDLVSIAEVVRDLYRSDAQPEQSYSERQLYEAALDRMAREIAAVQKLTDQEALKVIDEQLQKGPRRVKAEETDETEDTEEGDAEGIVEAA